jgi:hypothetical protein
MSEEFKNVDDNNDGVLTYKELDDFLILKVSLTTYETIFFRELMSLKSGIKL